MGRLVLFLVFYLAAKGSLSLEVCGENRCSQYCSSSSKGNYSCSCATGYQLDSSDRFTCKVTNGRAMMVVSTGHHVEAFYNYDEASSHLTRSSATIGGIAFHNKMSTLYWVTSAGVYHNSNTAPSKIFSLNGLNPTGLALDRATDNIYVSGLEDDVIGHERSVIKVISIKSMAKSVDVVTTQTDITDVAIDSGRGLLFWCEYLRPRTGRIIRSTLDGASTLWLYKISKIVHPIALVLDPIQSRVYWADFALQSISSCDYNGQRQKLEVKDTNGQPLSITFFESRISWTNVAGLSAIHSQMIDSNITTTQAMIHHEQISHIITTHSVLEPELKNPCASASCGNGLCLLRDADSTTCMCPEHEKVLSSSPTLICSDSSQADSTIKVDEMKENVADEIVMSNPSVISLSLILVCIAILIILATIGGLYCKRWRRTTSPPPKLRFRNASASVSEEGSTAWEEAAAIEANDRRSIVVQDKESTI